jgi:hypothetical protein
MDTCGNHYGDNVSARPGHSAGDEIRRDGFAIRDGAL